MLAIEPVVAAHLRRLAPCFQRPPRLVRAPGRINLIGEHTDYNQGWVMPAAINLAAWVAFAPSPRFSLRSLQFGDAVEFDLDQPPPLPPAGHWSRELHGVLCLLQQSGIQLRPAQFVIDGDVPIGAGLSSSAAVSVAVAFAALAASGAHLTPTALAQLCQRASHEFGGTRCGIMDLYIAVHGHAGEIAQLDTRSLEATWRPWPATLRLLACDTGVRHDNATSEYNQRRQECERGVAILAARQPGLTTLRDATPSLLAAAAAELGPRLSARARHVVSENHRVLAAADCLAAADYPRLGDLLNQSHRSMRDDYQVSCAALDRLAELCRRFPGVLGARMMGGGFGGCVLALLPPESIPGLRRHLELTYYRPAGLAPALWDCVPGPGVAEMIM